MSKSPWHKRYHSDALTGYRGLSLELRGAYTTILDLLYDSEDEALTASERWMAGQLDVSTRKWRGIRSELGALNKITVLPDGRVTNARYLREREKAEVINAKRAQAGGMGGRPRKSSTPENDANSREFSLFSTPENGLSGERKSDEHDQEMAENVGLEKANAFDLPPIRARVPDTRDQKPDIDSTHPIDSKDLDAAEKSNDGTGQDDAVQVPTLRDADLKVLFDAVCEASGFYAAYPTTYARAFDKIREWREAGLDFDETVLPAIRETVATDAEVPRSLNRYDKIIRSYAARNKARASTDRTPIVPAIPVMEPKDEDPDFRPLRKALHKTLGNQTYCHYLNRVRFEPVDNPQGKVLRVLKDKPGGLGLMDGERAEHVRALAQRYGFKDVW